MTDESLKTYTITATTEVCLDEETEYDFIVCEVLKQFMAQAHKQLRPLAVAHSIVPNLYVVAWLTDRLREHKHTYEYI